MDKSPDAFRTISEVADHLETPAHVLRFWESRFPQIRPVKRAGGRRYYRPSDVALLTGIKRLLHEEGLTIRGVQKILRDHGVRHVAGLSDETVPVDALVASPEDMPGMTQEEVPEAAFIAVEEEEEDELPPAPPAARPQPAATAQRSHPVQAVLPLFEAPLPLAATPDTPRQPTLRDDVTFASRIRGLKPGTLVAARPELARLAKKLSNLRAQMAERAEGGSA
ncbi:MAG: MerR family transcriptional regulator [Rhodobacterales bacterium]|nr:MerR family transcriptional regulator [Paracoccaceae bacterium]MDX5403057.1 MerR family transcriptional regulator [Rhodobacterales bacterium]